MSQRPNSSSKKATAPNKELTQSQQNKQVQEKVFDPEVLAPELLEQMSAQDKKAAENLLREMQEEISPEATPLWQFVNNNAPKIAVSVIGLVLIIAGFAFYHGYQESNLENARIELATIISNPYDAERLKALETFKQNAPAEIYVGIDYEMARAAILSGDTKKAEASFLAVIKAEGNSALGVTASINLADMYAKANEAEKALQIYDGIIKSIPTNLQATMYMNMADIAAAANLNEKAIAAYKKAIETMPKTEETAQDIAYFEALIQKLS